MFHEIIVSDSYFETSTTESFVEARNSLAHELGHIADVEDSISLGPAWLNEELPKLAKFKKDSEAHLHNKIKLSDAEIARNCDLPSAYASRHPTEDFAENYAQMICGGKNNFRKRHALVKKLLDSLTPMQQDSFRDAIQAARTFERGNAASALQKINNAITNNPDIASFYIDRAVYRRTLGSTKSIRAQRIADLLKARDIFLRNSVPDYDGNVRFIGKQLALIYDDNKEFSNEKSELLKVVDNDPTDSVGLMRLADCCMCMGDPKSGLVYADRAVAADVLNAGAYRSRAWAKTALEHFQDAIKDCTLSLYIEPKNQWALFQKSKCMFYLCEYSNARKVVCELLVIAPKSLDGTYAISLLDYRLGNYKLAMQEAESASRIKIRSSVNAVKLIV